MTDLRVEFLTNKCIVYSKLIELGIILPKHPREENSSRGAFDNSKIIFKKSFFIGS